MERTLQSQVISLSNCSWNKRRRCKNYNPSLLWNDMCIANKEWLKSIDQVRSVLHSRFVSARKNFDKQVQYTKRQYWYDPKTFRRSVGNIGIGAERQTIIPMQVRLNDGSLNEDLNIVLNGAYPL